MSMNSKVKRFFIIVISFIFYRPFEGSAKSLNERIGISYEHNYSLFKIDNLNFRFSKSQWRMITIKKMFKRPIQILQNVENENLIGNYQNVVEVIGKNEKLDLRKIIEQQCSTLQSALKTKKQSSLQARFLKGKKISICYVIEDSMNRIKSSVLFLSNRSGETEKYSYRMNNFTFSFPKNQVKKDLNEIQSFIKQIQSN